MAPAARSSFAFKYTIELTRWLPTWRMRPVLRCASTSASPSSTEWIIGFST